MHDHWFLEVFDWQNSSYDIKPLLVRGNAPVAVKGELTYLAGQKKTMKTHVAYALALAAMGSNKKASVGFELAKGNVPQKVILIDTEQPKSQYASIIKAMAHIAPEVNVKDWFIPLTWKGKAPVEMREKLQEAIAYFRPDLLILDGIADFVSDINSYCECCPLVVHLQSLAEMYNCAIIAVIHYNPGSDKERGHLGTVLANKADWSIRVKRERGNVKVSSGGESRGRPFTDFFVAYDELSNWVIQVGASSAMSIATMIPRLFIEVGKKEMDRKEIVELAQKTWGIKQSSSTTVDRALKEAKEKGLIVQNSSRGGYSLPKFGQKKKLQ